jgi:hypothetical protein
MPPSHCRHAAEEFVMAIGLRRKTRLDSRREYQKNTRRAKGVLKNAERTRRDERIIAKIRSTEAPYSPEVQSWLSAQLGKPSSRITDADVKALVG